MFLFVITNSDIFIINSDIFISFLWHSPLYDLVDETHFIKDIDF